MPKPVIFLSSYWPSQPSPSISFLRIIIIEQKTVARYISHGGQRVRCKARPNKSSPRLRNSSLTRKDHYEPDLAEDFDNEHRSSGSSTVNGTDSDEPPKTNIPLTSGSKCNPAFWLRNAFPRMATLGRRLRLLHLRNRHLFLRRYTSALRQPNIWLGLPGCRFYLPSLDRACTRGSCFWGYVRSLRTEKGISFRLCGRVCVAGAAGSCS